MTCTGLVVFLSSLSVAAQPALRDFSVRLAGAELHFAGVLEGGEGVDSVVLVYGAANLPQHTAMMDHHAGALRLVVDARPLLLGEDSVRLAYSVAAVDATGTIVAHIGTLEEPVEVIVTRVFDAGVVDAPEDPLVTGPPPAAAELAWHQTWWFWTAVAVVMLGGGVTAGLVLSSH